MIETRQEELNTLSLTSQNVSGHDAVCYEGEYLPPVQTAELIWRQMIQTTNRIMVDMQARERQWGATVVEIADSVSTLNTKVEMLMGEVERLHSMRTFVVPLSVPPKHLKMLQPIPVTIEGNGEEFTATFTEANISASGETEADAIAGLKDSLLSSYEILSTMPSNKLGPLPSRQWEILKSVIVRNE